MSKRTSGQAIASDPLLALADAIATELLTVHLSRTEAVECTRAQMMLRQSDGTERDIGGRCKGSVRNVILRHLKANRPDNRSAASADTVRRGWRRGETMKARKKPVVVDVEGPLTEPRMVTTAHGRVRAEAGDFVLRDPQTGDTWPIKPDIFTQTYEVMDTANNRVGGPQPAQETP